MSDKKFVLQFDFEGNIGPIKSSVADLQKSLKGIKLPDNIGTGLEKTFSRLAAEFDSFEAIVKTGFDDLGSISKAEKSFGKISALVSQLSVQAGSLTGVDPKKLIPQESLDRLKGLEKAWAEVKKESEKKSELDKEIQKQTDEIEEQEKALKKLTDQYDKLAAKNKALGSQKGTLANSKKAKESRRNEVLTQMTALEGQKGGKSSAEYKALSQEYTQLSQSIRGLETDIRNLDKEINNNKVEMAGLNTQISSSTEAYEKMRTQLTNLKNTQITPKGLVELRTEIAKLTGLNISEIPTDLEELQKTINSLTEKQLEEVAKSLAEIKTNGDALPGSLAPAKESVRGLGEAGQEVARTANEIESLKNQVLQFFSLTNSVQLFKRAITSALNTVKELDATMTEAAVVTEFDVSDMWEKLPQYSKEAQNLGVSINGMYQATTLYYQQGLKNQEAMELGIETMKMAKIAGMDSAESTKAMTAALRGFNMELNQTSAQRVNDVYSQLAAVTAADTSQIATAMEKTASIAASANMEFETTAAFLSQIIETTQEAPETAGTALKTIIARFAEVKSLREQGKTAGEDEEGEAIDVNKIQAALRTVGISMEGFFAGTEGLDSVLLKLSEKWSSLDFETQRYIATMAAGSRQQSRFIAMMSDYSRTTELVGEAQNSAGASQKQFEKTQKSLATSLSRLKNAWDQFTMGLANDEVLRGAVDTLTFVLESINKIIDAISGGNGLIKSVTSLAGAISALKLGATLFNSSGTQGLLGQFMGLGGFTETRTKEIGADGKEVETVVRSPMKQGTQAGLKAGSSFTAAFSKALKKSKEGEKGVKSFMSNAFTTQIIGSESEFKQAFAKLNSEGNEELQKLQQSLEKGNITVDQAAASYQKLGGNLSDLGKGAIKTSVNVRAFGGAIVSAGVALGMFSALLKEAGMEDVAEDFSTAASAITAVGGALTGLGQVGSTVVPILVKGGMSVVAAWGLIAVVAAVAVAAIAGAVAIFNNIKASSYEGRLEAATEAAERSRKAAEDAKGAYDSLLSSQSNYVSLQEKLDDLTAGTNEWKQALFEANNQVMQLLAIYPELSKYITTGSSGQMVISDEGWDQIIDQQMRAVEAANTAAAIDARDTSEIEAWEKQRQAKNKIYENFDSKNDEYGLYNAYETLRGQKITMDASQGEIEDVYRRWAANPEGEIRAEDLSDWNKLNQDQINQLIEQFKQGIIYDAYYTADVEKTLDVGALIDKIYQAYQDNNQLFVDEGALSELAGEVHLSTDALKTFETSILEYASVVDETSNELAIQASSILRGKIDPSLLTGDKKESGEAALAFASKNYESGGAADTYGFTGNLVGKNDVWKEDNKNDAEKNETFKQIAEKYGYTATSTDDLDNLRGLYAKIMGIEVSAVSGDLSKADLAEAIAEQVNADYAAEQTEELAKKLETITDKDTKAIYSALLSGDVSKLSEDQMEKFVALQEGELQEAASYFELGGEHFDNFIESFDGLKNNLITIENEKLDAMNQLAKTKGVKAVSDGADSPLGKVWGEASAAERQKYIDMVSLAGGENFENSLSTLLEGLSDEALGKVADSLDTFDWKVEGEGERFVAFLESLGVDFTKLGEEDLERFKTGLATVDATFKKINVKSVFDELTSGLQEARDVADQEKLTNEQYVKYLEEGLISEEQAAQWSFDGEGWVNVTNGMGDLVEALKANSLALYATRVEEAKKQKTQFGAKTEEIKKLPGQNRTSYEYRFRDKETGKEFVINDEFEAAQYFSQINRYEQTGQRVTYSSGHKEAYNRLITNKNVTDEDLALGKFSSREEYDNWWNYEYGGGKSDIDKLIAEDDKIRAMGGIEKLVANEADFDAFDEYYSEYEKIAALARQREKLERERNNLLKAGNAEEARAKRQEQINKVKTEIATQGEIAAGKRGEIAALIASNAAQTKKYGFNYDSETGEYSFDETEANKEEDENFKAFIESLKGLRDQMWEAEDAIEEGSELLEDYYDEDRQAYVDATAKIREAIISEQEEAIDALREVNDSINDANTKMIEAMQSAVDKYRQDRDNERTESDIEDKQRRLAYLQQDTSGANAVEIMKLQKEIEQDQEAYTDSLIDQKIQELQDQNDQAAEQRERQIQIAEEQLKLMKEDGSIWEEVETLLNGAFDTEGNLIEDSDLMNKLKEQAGFDSMSAKEQEQWLEQMKTTLTTAKSLSGIVKNDYATGSGGNGAGNINEGTNETEVKEPEYPKWDSNLPKPSTFTRNLYKGKTGEDVKGLQHALKLLGYYNGPIGGTFGDNTKAALIEFQKANNLDPDGNCGPATRKVFGNIYKYETGGLADFTGPAWLDGSKTRPEYVLNADQTQAFFSLVDVLESLRKNDSARTTQNTGDLNFDIDINVESINDTADLDMISQYVEDKIVASANYRNNNIVGRSR